MNQICAAGLAVGLTLFLQACSTSPKVNIESNDVSPSRVTVSLDKTLTLINQGGKSYEVVWVRGDAETLPASLSTTELLGKYQWRGTEGISRDELEFSAEKFSGIKGDLFNEPNARPPYKIPMYIVLGSTLGQRFPDAKVVAKKVIVEVQ